MFRFSSLFRESRLLSFKNGGGEKMGGEEREGGGSGEVSVEDGMLVKLEEMLKGVEGEDREVLEEVITEAFSGDEEALESAEEELGKLGEEVKEWMGADLSLEKVVVVGRLLGVEVSEEALSFVEGEGEGEVKEGDVETVGSGEEVKRWVEEVEAVEGVSVRVEGTVVVIEGGKKVMRVDGGKLRKLQLQGAVRSLVQRARLEKNIGEIEGERGLEGVEFSVVDTTKVKVVYGGVEQVVNLVNVENRWVRQMAVLRVVGRGVRERGEEKIKVIHESSNIVKKYTIYEKQWRRVNVYLQLGDTKERQKAVAEIQNTYDQLITALQESGTEISTGKNAAALKRLVAKYQAMQPKEQGEEEKKLLDIINLFGDSIDISSIQISLVKKHIKHLGLMPEGVVKHLKNLDVKLRIGNQDIVGLSNDPYYKKHGPRGWNRSSWEGVPGGYNTGSETVYAGRGGHGSVSLILHEYGHAFGHNIHQNSAPAVKAAHTRLYSKLSNYAQQGGPGGSAGMSEFFAESFAHYFMSSKEVFVRRYDAQWHNYLKFIINETAKDKS